MVFQPKHIAARLGYTAWINVAYPEGGIILMLNPKCGNTSIKKAVLAAQGQGVDRPHKRVPLLTRKEALRSPLRKIAVVRNPYARAVSLWHAQVRDAKTLSPLMKKCGFTADMSFLEFLRQLNRVDAYTEKHMRPQSPAFYLMWRYIPDEMIQIEDPEGWARIQAQAPGLPDLPHANNSHAPDWRELCQGEAQRLILRRYGRDFEVCGYPVEIT
ncbi:MAG: sulfotransferase family 2 domain-containing protein [Pseudomonadota bacterium]